MSGDDVDFVVMHPDGAVVYDVRDQELGLRRSIAEHVPDLGTQGMGRLRAWFADDFGDPALHPNPVAEHVFNAMGYHHPSGWRGPVALSMEENSEGYIEPLTPEARHALDELLADVTGPYVAELRAPSSPAEVIEASLPADPSAGQAVDTNTAATESAHSPTQPTDLEPDL